MDYCEVSLREAEATSVGAIERIDGEDQAYGIVLKNTRVLELVVILQGGCVVVAVCLNSPSEHQAREDGQRPSCLHTLAS